MAIVQIIIQGKNDSSNAFNSTRKDIDLLDAAVGKLKNAAAALGLSFSAMKLIELGKDAAMMAARYETLGVSMDVVGARAGYTAAELDKIETSLHKNGIAMIESRDTITKMAGAHMDLAKASELSRVAQDAAVIGGINSSEAFNRMIDGIQRGEVEILKTIGINVNFEDSYKRIAQQLGKTADELTETEKVTARTNAVMEKGKDIAGAYEAAMGTAGKQVTSMKRYMDNLKVTLGEVFQDALIVSVETLTGTLKDANTESEKLQQEGQLKQWGRDTVMVMAFVADAVKGVINVFATLTGAAITNTMGAYKLYEAGSKAMRFDFSGAKQSLMEGAGYYQSYIDDMKKRWGAKGFQETAAEMFAKRDAEAPALEASKKALEEKLLAEGEAARQAEEDRAKAMAEEKAYLEDVKNNIQATKEFADATKDLGKERLQFANEKYGDRLKEEVDLYKEGARAAADLVKPLKIYNTEANAVFNERLTNEKSALDKLGDQYKGFKKKISLNATTKEAKAAGIEILKAYKETASGIISTEQDRYKTLLEGERAYANQVLSLIQAKKQEIRDLKASIAEANVAFGEKMRGDLQGGYTTGQYRYLDSSLDAYDKRMAALDELRRKEAEYDAITDPAKKQQKILGLIADWEKWTGQVEVNGQVIVTQEEAYKQVAEERERIQKKVTQSAEEEQKTLENLYQQTIDKMETYKSKLLELDNILRNLSREIVIDLKVNGLSAISQIQGLVGSATQSPYSSGGSTAPAGVSSSLSSWWDSIHSGGGWETVFADAELRASGGPVRPYATYRINEDGTEFLTMGSKGGYITPAGQGPQSGPSVNIEKGAVSIVVQGGGNADEIASAALDALARKLYPKLQTLNGYRRTG
ncbi:MAG: hypothetical protein VB050_03220 [Geobacteraceae bacterium]|nr:hypothetical protein [Geobacteraceae bacterium]